MYSSPSSCAVGLQPPALLPIGAKYATLIVIHIPFLLCSASSGDAAGCQRLPPLHLPKTRTNTPLGPFDARARRRAL